jgi:chaperonin GroES
MSTVAAHPQVTPIGDRVLVRRQDETEQIKGGIVIPDSAKEKSQEAVVVALGTGRKTEDGQPIAFDVKVGDKVLISKYGGTDVTFGDEAYLVVREEDILAILG